jgi:antitoxin component HigA of HigAB toxin-antitoxin module
MNFEIKSKKEYHQAMVDIYNLMNKGESKLNKTELKKLAAMSVAAEKYEDEVLGLKPKTPQNIIEAIELKLFENKMNQAGLATAIGLGKSKVSEILSGKRNPDVKFLKGVYKVLKIDAGFLLEHV